jgi:hypothetical protein
MSCRRKGTQHGNQHQKQKARPCMARHTGTPLSDHDRGTAGVLNIISCCDRTMAGGRAPADADRGGTESSWEARIRTDSPPEARGPFSRQCATEGRISPERPPRQSSGGSSPSGGLKTGGKVPGRDPIGRFSSGGSSEMLDVIDSRCNSFDILQESNLTSHRLESDSTPSDSSCGFTYRLRRIRGKVCEPVHKNSVKYSP